MIVAIVLLFVFQFLQLVLVLFLYKYVSIVLVNNSTVGAAIKDLTNKLTTYNEVLKSFKDTEIKGTMN